jgi:hypothetical protein
MIEINYGVVRIEGGWMVISAGLRIGPYATEPEAEEVARRMADQAAGLKVELHLQDEVGQLHRESQRDEL